MNILLVEPTKYPRYNRSQSLSCKLLENDIEEIVKSFKEGKTIDALARQYGVAITTIRRYVEPNYRQKATRWHYNYIKKHTELLNTMRRWNRKTRKRKWQLCSDAIKEYQKNFYSKEYWYKYHKERRIKLIEMRNNKIEKILGKNFYITKDLENLLKVSREYIRQLRNAKRILFVKVGKRFYYPCSFKI